MREPRHLASQTRYGWADAFLATPDRGLDDVYAGFSGNYDRLEWYVTWQQFHTEKGSKSLSNALDGSL